jgi:sugar lactone lactonase YvrE
MNRTRRSAATAAAIVTATAGLLAASGILAGAAHAATAFIGPLNTVTVVASAVPANGDQNPYGVAVVKESIGALHQGNVLVSNFNDNTNTQGAGTTIVQVTPRGSVSVFAQIDRNLAGCPGGVGLTTALVELSSGLVIVGSLPTQTVDSNTVISGSGCLIVLDSRGHVRETFSGHGINGPWDMTALDLGDVAELFVTNVLNGTVAGDGRVVDKGTVLRLVITSESDERPILLSVARIGSGFPERTDQAALVIGPTGVGLGPDGTLYVADTLNSRIAAIPGAIFRFSDDHAGRTVTAGGFLNGPLGLAIAPNGDILTVNSQDGNMVETAPDGTQLTFKTVDAQGDPAGAGNLFGLAVAPGADAVYFVDDFGGPTGTPPGNTNSLDLLSAP